MIMNNITPYPVLEYVVNVIKKAISDIKIEYASISVANLKDGNDTIILEQLFDSSGTFATILISDPSEIIISEDLLPVLNELHQQAEGKLQMALQGTTVILNGLDVETQLIFQAVRNGFDEISDSYEFGEVLDKETTKVKSDLKFGANELKLTVMNEQFHIFVVPEFDASFDPAVRKTIEADALKVQHAVFAIFKEDKPLNDALSLDKV
jgi:hypothetical protein